MKVLESLETSQLLIFYTMVTPRVEPIRNILGGPDTEFLIFRSFSTPQELRKNKKEGLKRVSTSIS